jgi:hypothetical protein
MHNNISVSQGIIGNYNKLLISFLNVKPYSRKQLHCQICPKRRPRTPSCKSIRTLAPKKTNELNLNMGKKQLDTLYKQHTMS